MAELIVKALARLVRWLGVRTVLSLALLWVALSSVALGLADLIRGLETDLSLPLVALGVALGWLLGRSSLPGWLGGVSSLILGAGALVVRVGRLDAPLTALLRALTDLPVDGASVASAWTELGTRASTLLTRTRDWSLAVVEGQAAFDPLATALTWGLAVWLAAVWAGWAVRRHHRPLLGIAPAGALLAISLSYTWDTPATLPVLLGATLLSMMLTGQVARERRWQAAGMDYSLELRFDLALVAVPLALALVAAAILAPSISVRPVARAAGRWMVAHLSGGKQVADSMGLEPLAGPGVALDAASAPGLPNRSLIGSGPELSEQVVMRVSLQDLRPEPLEGQPPRYYWRGATYDHYSGRGWLTTPVEKVSYRAGEPAIPRRAAQRVVRQEVRAVEDLGGLLYRAGELVTADQDYRIAWRSPEDAFGAEIRASVYQADSLVPALSETQLRAAGRDYPDWVGERYLTLPDDVPPRVHWLARDLTATEPTPYDQARAIESYLRTFTYTLDLPAPPPNREVADYFLFDLQQGYCDYYATSMVVLARSAGLPARLVRGYASGSYDAQAGHYVVTAADAHSWVEVYFPGYGWVEFEPTGGRPAIQRPADVAPDEVVAPQTPLEPLSAQQARSIHPLWLGLMGAVALLALGGVSWWMFDGWRLRRMSPERAVATLYQRLYRHGRRLAVAVEAGDTPFEFEAGLAERVATLAQGRRWGESAASVHSGVRQLTDLHVRGLYSSRKLTSGDRWRALEVWRRLRWGLWLAWLWQRIK